MSSGFNPRIGQAILWLANSCPICMCFFACNLHDRKTYRDPINKIPKTLPTCRSRIKKNNTLEAQPHVIYIHTQTKITTLKLHPSEQLKQCYTMRQVIIASQTGMLYRKLEVILTRVSRL